MADQPQQHLDDDGRLQRGGGAPSDPLLTLGGAPRRVAGAIDPDAPHALASQRLLPHRGPQAGLRGHVQQGLQFRLRAPGGGLLHQAPHGSAQGAVAGEADVAEGRQPVAVEAQGVAQGVVAAVVVVAAQVADLPEVVEGGGARRIAERRPELPEGDRRAGGQQRGQHVGGARCHVDPVAAGWPAESLAAGRRGGLRGPAPGSVREPARPERILQDSP